MDTPVTIVHLYAGEMDTYGDTGNVITLMDRLLWRGISARLERVGVGDRFDLRRADLIFGGGGQDRAQAIVADDLQHRAAGLRQAAAEGVAMLAVCGTYQLFGRRFVTADGRTLTGIGLFDLDTIASGHRMIGELVAESAFGPLVGFENHGGKTRLDTGQKALARVVRGHGNDGGSGYEGAVSGNVYGTYLHGPVLPKNPAFCDALLSLALAHAGRPTELEPLDDSLELLAAHGAAYRHLPRRRFGKEIRVLRRVMPEPSRDPVA